MIITRNLFEVEENKSIKWNDISKSLLKIKRLELENEDDELIIRSKYTLI